VSDHAQQKGDKHYGTIIPAALRRAEFAMSDTARTILIALGVALVVVILVPTLFMGGMMGTMMGSGIMGGMGAMGGAAWVMLGLVLVILLAGVGLLVSALRR
jgi:hypothetical protein